MIKVGLTGGYASGKTFVASHFERLGCHLIFADKLGHEILLEGEEAYGPVVAAFGPEILDVGGAIDRKKLAKVVFHSPDLLHRLTAIVHPAVFRLEEKLLAKFAAEDPRGIAMVEAAILVETGRFTFFDRLIVTSCDEETQIQRALKRGGVTREEILARLAKQLPLSEKKTRADFVIDTDGTEDQTIRQVKEVYNALRNPAEHGRT